MPVIDLRSDTVTQPTPEMREAMYRAEVGDDGWGEDPTINRLQEQAAALMGKEAALFMPSGTMSNLVAVLTHCRHGDEIIVGSEAHILHHEVGGAAAVGGVVLRQVPNDIQGRLDPAAVEATIRPQGIAFPPTTLICLENTHNRCGGGVLTPKDMAVLGEVAARHGIPIHLDGARLFNAAVYLGVPASALTKEATTVAFCLSKGLSCPVGSLLCGPADFIAQARKNRRMVGGGMRQAGIVAAAGIVALETMIERLAEDHENARILAYGLAELPGLRLDPGLVPTNIVAFDLTGMEPPVFMAALAQRGLLISGFGGRRLRMVTHYGISRADVKQALAIMQEVVAESRVRP